MQEFAGWVEDELGADLLRLSGLGSAEVLRRLRARRGIGRRDRQRHRGVCALHAARRRRRICAAHSLSRRRHSAGLRDHGRAAPHSNRRSTALRSAPDTSTPPSSSSDRGSAVPSRAARRVRSVCSARRLLGDTPLGGGGVDGHRQEESRGGGRRRRTEVDGACAC